MLNAHLSLEKDIKKLYSLVEELKESEKDMIALTEQEILDICK